MKIISILVLLILFPLTNSFADVGRYQIFFSPHARADAYLVDTSTGKVWSPVTYTDIQDSPQVWKHQERIDSFEDFILWAREQKPTNEE